MSRSRMIPRGGLRGWKGSAKGELRLGFEMMKGEPSASGGQRCLPTTHAKNENQKGR